MDISETNNAFDPEAEKERRIDHLVDTGTMTASEAREHIEREDADRRRRAEVRRTGGSQHERVKLFARAAETLTLFDDL